MRSQGGQSLVWIVVIATVVGVLLIYFGRNFTHQLKASKHYEIKAEIESLKGALGARIDCGKSLYPSGSLSAACASTGLLAIVGIDGNSLVSAADPPSVYPGNYVLRGKCVSGKIVVEFAKTRSKVTAFADIGPSTLDKDPLTKTPFDWKELFEGQATPCAEGDGSTPSFKSCIAVACQFPSANCGTWGSYSNTPGLYGTLHNCKEVTGDCVETACSYPPANCGTWGSYSNTPGLYGVLHNCKHVQPSCIRSACAQSGSCGTWGSYPNTPGLYGVLYQCKDIPS